MTLDSGFKLVGAKQAVRLGHDWLYNGTRRTRLQHVEPAAEDCTVFGIVAAVSGYGEKKERSACDEWLLSGSVLWLSREVPARE